MRNAVAQRQAMVDGLTATYNSRSLVVYTGSPPTNLTDAPTGTLLSTHTLPSPAFGAANSATPTVATANAITAVSAGNSGIPGYARVVNGSTTLSQFTASLNGSAWAQSTAYALNDIRINNNNVYRCVTAGTSASSGGGPSGTGTGITDGTAVWDYVQAAGEVRITPPAGQTQVIAGGQVSVSSFTISLAEGT